jgi:hypothetical protein
LDRADEHGMAGDIEVMQNGSDLWERTEPGDHEVFSARVGLERSDAEMAEVRVSAEAKVGKCLVDMDGYAVAVDDDQTIWNLTRLRLCSGSKRKQSGNGGEQVSDAHKVSFPEVIGGGD